MDPFTQKLLARTQARKNQLVKKREELEDCRARRNSPIKDRGRRPLSEDNTDSGSAEIDTEDIKRRRIGSDDSGKSAVLKNPRDIDVNSPSVQARKERLLKMQIKDQENGVTPKKHWKATLTQGANDTSSASVASRSAAFETNTREERKENAKDKKHCELVTSNTPGKLAVARSVFENASEQGQIDSKQEKFFAPPKPPRVGATESNPEENKLANEQPAAKRKAPSPPKAKDVCNEVTPMDDHATSVVKRKAPEPPSQDKNKININSTESSNGTECQQGDKKVRKASSRSSSIDEEADGSTGPFPAKRERKGSVNNLDHVVTSNQSDQPTPKPRKKVQTSGEAKSITPEGNVNGSVQKPMKAVVDTTVTIVATPIDDDKKSKTDKLKQRPKAEPCIIQACVVEESAPQINARSVCSDNIVKAVPQHDSELNKETCKSERIKKTTGDAKEKSRKSSKPEKISDGFIESAHKERKPSNSSRKTREPTRKEEFEFKVPKKPAVIRDNCHVDLNETLNLNDVNIHEITFSFDFGQFDQQMEKDKETMFVSYEEKCKQLEKQGKREEKKRKDSEGASFGHRLSSVSSDCEPEERGTYQSGYNSKSSEQYATKTVHKAKPAVSQRPTRTQEAIKMLLEEAAYQQNIVLQASQALNLCVANDITFRGSTEEIEAERVLLLASEHRTACLDEVQNLKTGSTEGVPEFSGGKSSSADPSCIATLNLSGIKIILRQDFMDVLRVGIRSDLGVFYFVCIIQHGPHEFHCTRVLSTNDATEGNFLMFPEKFTINDINPDFNITIKVFCMNVKKTIVNTTTTPSKHKIFQSPKVVKGMFAGRRGTEAPSPVTPVSPSPQTVFRTSNFSLVGVTHINLPIINSKSFSLDKVPDTCPLSSSLEMKAECSPLYSSHVKGFLTILEDIGGYGAWQRRWCMLEGAVISYWRYPGDESTKPPLGCINLSECISDEVTRVARDLCARPNTMELKLKRSCGTEVKYLLAADTKTDRATWINSLNDALRDGHAWTVKEKKPLYPDLSRMHNQDVFMCSKNRE